MLHAEAAIRDERGAPVARGSVGELTLRGPHVCLGYFRRPEEWAKVFRDGWLWTGDLARQDADGRYFIVGRSKEMYISGGENVYPVEIETAIYACSEVAECAVLGVPHERWGETGLAAVALKPGAQLDEAGLLAALKDRLAGYKLPRHVLFLEALPKTGAGKIAKPQIRQLFERRWPR
jgi:fatty-acyl-CoA synthase